MNTTTNTQIDNTILGILATHSIAAKDRYDATGPKAIAKIYNLHTNAVKASIARLLETEQIKRVSTGVGITFYHLTNR